MSEFKGRMVGVGFAPQSNYTTPVATPVYSIPWMDLSLKDAIETESNESSFGNIAHYNDVEVRGVHSEGEIKTKLWHKGLYYQLMWLFGQAPTKVSNNDGSYTYTFNMLNSNQHNAFTVALNDPNDPVYFPTVLLNEATIEWSPTDFATYTASVIGKRSVTATAFTAAFVDDNEFKPDSLVLKMANDVSGLSTATNVEKFTSASLSVSKNVEGLQTSDSGQDYGSFANGDLEATLSFEKLYTDTTYKSLAANGTAKAVQFGFSDSTSMAGTEHATELLFTFPKVKFTSRETSYGLSDTATESLEAAALFDTTAGYIMQAVLTTRHNIS